MTCCGKLNLIVDKVVKGKIYPSLARFQAEPYTAQWRTFGDHWPNTIPLRLQEYCESHGLALLIHNVDSAWPANTFYPVAFGWFNFEIDYFDLLPTHILHAVAHRNLKILFYYHEGDNPARIKQRLDQCVTRHQLPHNCYVFVSSNSAADSLPQFVSFQDSELWYWHRNKNSAPVAVHDRARSRNFTVLNRLHKWWRAAAMTDLKQHAILDNSYWSYCEGITEHDCVEDCAIEIDAIDGLRQNMGEFLAQAPYLADDLTQTQRNDHHYTLEHFHSDSYCNIVLETMFDWDQSGGVLLSEKTFKPIKHGQMFFIAGGAGSLQALRDMGYRVFDHVLDNHYDTVSDNTQRWIALRSAIVKAHLQGVAELFAKARSDIEHNQQLFLASKQSRVSMLLQKIHDKSS